MQIIKVLKNYDICIVTHECLNISFYEKIFDSHNLFCKYVFFDKKFFLDISTYSSLLLSPIFYKSFKKYEYILIYQLDAYVFSNQLQYWCNKKYDYIGAPWFGRDTDNLGKMTNVGNGGFSLRRTCKAIKILKRVLFLKRMYYLYLSIKINKLISFYRLILPFLFLFKLKKNKDCLMKLMNNELDYNEDMFWCLDVVELFEDFRLPDVNEALKFSFEVNPSVLFKLNGNKLPFGCHAWDKYDYKDFWLKYIN